MIIFTKLGGPPLVRKTGLTAEASELPTVAGISNLKTTTQVSEFNLCIMSKGPT